MILGGLLLCDRLRAGAAAGLDRGQADPRLRPRRAAGRRGLRPEAQPAAIRPGRLRRRRRTATGSPSACPAGPPTRARRKTKSEPDEDGRAKTKTTKPAAADGRKTFGSRVGISRPKPKNRQKVLEEMDESDVGRSTSDYELPAHGPAAAGRADQLRRAGEGGPPQGQNPGKDLPRFRLQHPRGGDSDRAGHRPVRGRTGGRPAAEQDHRPGRRPGHRPARAERADRGPAAGQEHRRHRGAQQRAADRPPPRGHGRGQRQGPEDADSRSTWARTWPATRWWSI